MRSPGTSSRGLTLVELIVAMAIGLLVVLVVGVVFVQGSRSHSEDERYARLIENGRFALDQITRSLRMTGFYGEAPGLAINSLRPGPGVMCDIDLSKWEQPILFNSADSPANNPDGDPELLAFNPGACPGVLRGWVWGTGMLAVKQVESNGITSGAAAGTWYVESKGSAEAEFRNDAANDSLSTAEIERGGAYWRYTPHVFYVARFSDENGLSQPYLCRSQWSGSGFVAYPSDTSARDACLASGIEQVHVQFGIDTDGDGVANRYSALGPATSAEEAVTARVYVLARTETPDPAYEDSKLYTLGDLKIDKSAVDATERNFHRRVFSSTVKLRNPYNRITSR